jgi:hypothetical protein
MRRSLPALVLALVGSLVLVAAGSAPAAAKPHPDHASVTDPTGDAPAAIDLMSGTYRVGRSGAEWSVRVKALSETTFLAFEVWPLTSAWDRIAVFREHGKTVGKVYFVDNEEETKPYLRKCAKLKVTWSFSTDKVTVKAPFSCLQASAGAPPYEFHVFSRIGGVKNSPGDFLQARTLDF